MNTATAIFKLGSLAEISAGHPIRGSVDSLPHGNVSVVQMRDIVDEQSIDWKKTAKVTLTTKREHDWLQDEDILLSTRGTKNYATIVSLSSSKAVAAPSLFVLRVKQKETILPGFLCWLLNQPPAQSYFQRGATGSYIMNLKRSVVEDMPITLPSIERQQVISELFRASAEEKRVMEQLIKNRELQLEALANQIFQTTGDLK